MKHTCKWIDNSRVGRSSCTLCMEVEVALWDAINRYAVEVGGDPSKHVYGAIGRMKAVADVTFVIDRVIQQRKIDDLCIEELAKGSNAASRFALDVRQAVESHTLYVTHVYDNADALHDYYVHLSAKTAVRHAASDVVRGRFGDAIDPDNFETELVRVIDAVTIEPGTNRRYVRCDAWHAQIDEMKVLV